MPRYGGGSKGGGRKSGGGGWSKPNSISSKPGSSSWPKAPANGTSKPTTAPTGK
jgi:hypothetical protein